METNEQSEIDLESFAKSGEQVPEHRPGRRYRIRIDKEYKVIHEAQMTGAQILSLVGKSPERYRLDQKFRGGATEKVEPTESVKFTRPGIERFMTLPLDQTEGELNEEPTMAITPRRHFDLPEDDREGLERRALPWETIVDGQDATAPQWVLIHDSPLTKGYCRRDTKEPIDTVIAAVRMSGYPGGALDMVCVFPPLCRADGRPINGLSDIAIDGRTYQQWSRHYTPENPFRVGQDSLVTHLTLAEEWLGRELVK